MVIDFDVAKKVLKKKEDIIALIEDIEDIVTVELSKTKSRFLMKKPENKFSEKENDLTGL